MSNSIKNGVAIYETATGTGNTTLINMGSEDIYYATTELENLLITNISGKDITVDLYLFNYITPNRDEYVRVEGTGRRPEEMPTGNTLKRYFLLKEVTMYVGTSISLSAEELVYDMNQFSLGISFDSSSSGASVKITTRQITSSTKYKYKTQRRDFGYKITPSLNA